MCIGEALDTIRPGEREHLRMAASEHFPTHSFDVHDNGEGLIWIVLDPPLRRADLLRFTICRISPCVMVMVEDGEARRQFCSANDAIDAMAVARRAADHALLATTTHEAHAMLQ